MNNDDANSQSNSLKAKAGIELDKIIEHKLSILVDDGIIKEFKKDENFKHKDFEYKKQYLANFSIETLDNKFIVVRSSASFRSDRSKIGLYDLDGIIKYSDTSNEIIASVYVVPDIQVNNKDFINATERLRLKQQYFPVSHILTLSDFISFLEEYEQTTEDIENDNEEIIDNVLSFATVQERGSYYGKRGNQYESEIVQLLSDKRNLINLKNNNKNVNQTYSSILNKIIEKNSINVNDVIKLCVSNTIPLLKNGGKAKTDIILIIEDSNGVEFMETISIKNTSKERVTCHDYSVKDYVRVLNCENTKLEKYLNLFQEYPSYSEFENQLPDDFTLKEFKDLLSQNRNLFSQWVLCGMHDEENLISPEKQISKYILIKRDTKHAFYTMDEYMSLISKKEKESKFGVPFSWTYPSKQRGKRIQLKVQIIV